MKLLVISVLLLFLGLGSFKALTLYKNYTFQKQLIMFHKNNQWNELQVHIITASQNELIKENDNNSHIFSYGDNEFFCKIEDFKEYNNMYSLNAQIGRAHV